MAAPAAGHAQQPRAVDAPVTAVSLDNVLPALNDRRNSSASVRLSNSPPKPPFVSVSSSPTARRATLPGVETQKPPSQHKTPPIETATPRPNGLPATKPPASLIKAIATGRTTTNAPPTPPLSAMSTPAVNPPLADANIPSPAPSVASTTTTLLPVPSSAFSARHDAETKSESRPAYKMKRTGRPGILPNGIHSANGSRTPTPTSTAAPGTPSKTPTPFRANFPVETQPQPQPKLQAQPQPQPQTKPSPKALRNSKPASIESDQPSAKSVATSTSLQNGIKRRGESIVDLPQPVPKRIKVVNGSKDSPVDVVPAALITSLPSDFDASQHSTEEESLEDDDDVTEDASDSDNEDGEEKCDDDEVEITGDNGEEEEGGALQDDDELQNEDASLSLLGSRTAASTSPGHFRNAPSGRPYNRYIDKKGVEVATKGALLPDGYKRWHDPAAPWICPIRSCRLLFALLPSLGRHFSRGHRATNLNDNLDGTLTITKLFSSRAMSLGARVVSQKKLPTQEPLAEPRVKKGMFLLPPAPVAAPAIATSKTPSKTPIKAPSKATELPHAMTTKPQSAASQGKEFLQSASGRDYSKSFTGGLGFGILFPDGYKLSKYPGLPWICPVRDCQRVMPGIQNLGAHFTTKHRYSKFNDNGDGTLSTVGRHSSIRSIVVSQNVRPASEMEPLAAQGPVGYKPKETIAPDTSDAVVPAAESTTQATLLSKLSNTTQEQKDEMWDYVKSFVTTGMQRLGRPRTGKAALYFNAPRIRDLRWNEARVRANPNVEPRATHLAAVLIQLTGDYADKPCDHCKGGGGHFEGCVIASSKGAPEMSVAYGSCANCLNGHGRVKCSLSSTARQRFAQRFPHLDYNAVNEELRLTVYRLNSDGGPPRPPTFSDADTAAARAAHEARKGTINGAGNGAGASCEIMGKQGAGSSSSAQLTSDNEPLSHRNKLRQSGVSGRVPEPYRDTFGRRRSGRIAEYGETTTPSLSGVRSSLSGQARAPKQRSSPLLFAGNAQLGADALEMEDWEVAPGRVQSTTNDNIAFSNAYLTSSHMVPINHSMSYRVEVVRPGSTFTFDADARATRTCALASGKLCVTVGDSNFVMGPHGMFLVSPGKTFSVQNRLYIDAYLHITALLN